MKKILVVTFFLSSSFFIAAALFWNSGFWFLRPEYPTAYFLLGIGIILFMSGLIGGGSLLRRYSPKLLILWLAVSVIVLFILFPPWARTYRLPSSNIKAMRPVGYRFLLHPPEANRVSGVSIDFSRLGLQCGIVLLIASALYCTLLNIKNNIDTTRTKVSSRSRHKTKRDLIGYARKAERHWKEYRPKLYQYLLKKGTLYDQLYAAGQQAETYMLEQQAKPDFNLQTDYHAAEEVALMTWILLPDVDDETDEPEMIFPD